MKPLMELLTISYCSHYQRSMLKILSIALNYYFPKLCNNFNLHWQHLGPWSSKLVSFKTKNEKKIQFNGSTYLFEHDVFIYTTEI